MSILTVLVAVALIALILSRQLAGEAVRGRRLIVLPVVLSVIGIVQLSGQRSHPQASDILLIAISAAVAVAIGLGLGALTRLQAHDGHLWAQLPRRGLWLWGGLFASRLLITLIAQGAGAHLAAGSSAILLVLGLNRLAQALVVIPRALAAGIPFAPEKDGRVFGGEWFDRAK